MVRLRVTVGVTADELVVQMSDDQRIVQEALEERIDLALNHLTDYSRWGTGFTVEDSKVLLDHESVQAAALVRLGERARQAEDELAKRDKAVGEFFETGGGPPPLADLLAMLRELRAALAAAEAERDRAMTAAEKALEAGDKAVLVAKLRGERLAVVETALRKIANTATDLPHARRLDRDAMREIARAALGCETGQDGKGLEATADAVSRAQEGSA